MGKSGVLEHKSGNISEMRKDRRKVTTQRSFERYYPRLPMASSPPILGVCNYRKLQLLLSQERVKLRIENLAHTFTISRAHYKFFN